MKTFVAISLLLCVLLIFSIRNFKSEQSSKKTEAIAALREQYLIEANVDAVRSIDSIFSQNKEYVDLKKKQYREWMRAGSFNNPPSESVQKEVMKALNAKYQVDHDRMFCISIFRMAIMFQIVDELRNPALPSKEAIVNDFRVML